MKKTLIMSVILFTSFVYARSIQVGLGPDSDICTKGDGFWNCTSTIYNEYPSFDLNVYDKNADIHEYGTGVVNNEDGYETRVIIIARESETSNDIIFNAILTFIKDDLVIDKEVNVSYEEITSFPDRFIVTFGDLIPFRNEAYIPKLLISVQ